MVNETYWPSGTDGYWKAKNYPSHFMLSIWFQSTVCFGFRLINTFPRKQGTLAVHQLGAHFDIRLAHLERRSEVV
jgi:hypothetical protein